MRASGPSTVKTVEHCDRAFQRSIKREQTERLHQLRFLARRENVDPAGADRAGQTHLAIAAASRGDEVRAAATIDRLLHSHIVNIGGNSYRMRPHQGLWAIQRAFPGPWGRSPASAVAAVGPRPQPRSGAALWSLRSRPPLPRTPERRRHQEGA